MKKSEISLICMILISSAMAKTAVTATTAGTKAKGTNVGDDLDSLDKKGFAYMVNGKLDSCKIAMLAFLGLQILYLFAKMYQVRTIRKEHNAQISI